MPGPFDTSSFDPSGTGKVAVLTIKSRLAMAFGSIALFNLASVGLATYIPQMAVSACSLLSILAAGWGFVHISRIVCGGLGRQQKKFDEIATTLDLSRRSASPRRDEFGASAAAFDRLMRRVEETVVTVHQSTENLSLAIAEIASGNVDLSTRTDGQAASLEESAVNLSELSASVRQNADHMREALVLARDASAQVEAGAAVAGRMVETIERINRNSIKISEVTGIIEGIAFQTNLLALNAAVEAARAGSRGQSFAVVASEVRGLAQRSTVASREIKDLILSSAATAQQGLTQALNVGQATAQLQRTIEAVSRSFALVETASGEQRTRIEQINLAVDSMNSVTQQNATLVEQLANAAKALEDQTLELKKEVAAFNV
jgi:methyl-accepting chemotaxis protein